MKILSLKRLTILLVSLFVATGFIAIWHILSTQSATYTWDGGGISDNWNDCDNWSTNICPTVTDIAVFDGAISNDSAIVNVAISVVAIEIQNDYAGTITQAGSITVNDFTMAGGTFAGGSQAIIINGDFELTGGTFTATSGKMSFENDFVDHNFTYNAAATFSHNNGEVALEGRNITAAVDTGITFFDFTLNFASDIRTLNMTPGEVIAVEGEFNLGAGCTFNEGTIEVQGTMTHTGTCSSSSQLGNGEIDIQSAITVNAFDGGWFPGLRISNAGAEVILPGNMLTDQFFFGGSVFLDEGLLDGDATAILFTGEFFSETNGIFNAGNGSVRFVNFPGEQSIIGSPTFNILRASTLVLEASETITINESFYVSGGLLQSSSPGNAATIDFDGTFAQLDSLEIQDITWVGTEAACYDQCINAGNNTNIDFNERILIFETSDRITSESGDTFTIEVALNQQPTNDVTIPVESSDTSEGTVSSASLTFTNANWEDVQTITVTGQDDGLNDGSIDYTITIGSSSSTDPLFNGLAGSVITGTNLDNDQPVALTDFEDPDQYQEEDTTRTQIENSIGSLEEFYYLNTERNLTDEGAEYEPSTSPLVYDEINNSLWYFNANGSVIEYEIDTTILNEFIVLDGQAYDMVLDEEPTRNRLWVTESNNNGGPSITALNDNGTVFIEVTLNGATDFADAPSAIVFDNRNDVDASNDIIWVADEDDQGIPNIVKINAVTGAFANGNIANSSYTINGSILEENDQILDLAYDSNEDAIWAVITTSVKDLAVKINAATGAYYNGTFENSSVQLHSTPSLSQGTPTTMLYDNLNERILIANNFLIAIDSATLAVEFYKPTGQVQDMVIEPTRNILYLGIANWSRYDLESDNFLEDIATESSSINAAAIDSQGDLWSLDAEEIFEEGSENFLHEVVYGVEENTYYTIVTELTAAADTSALLTLSDIDVAETLNNQSIYYALSFDEGATYRINADLRPIASNDTLVHGNVDGTWYYRENGGTWAVASVSEAATAISESIADGPNNRMTGTALELLDEADLTAVNGWDTNVDDVYSSATFFSNDTHENPQVDSLLFNAETDNEPGILVSEISNDTTEAGITATFTVVLLTEPTNTVIINTASDNTDEGIVTTGSILTFTTEDWAIPQTVTITGQDDDFDDGDIDYNIDVTIDQDLTLADEYDVIASEQVAVTNIDDDVSGIIVSTISNNTTEAGVTGTFTVEITARPAIGTEVHFDISSSDLTEGTITSGSELWFDSENWDIPQTVTVTGQDDAIVDGNIAYLAQVVIDVAETTAPIYDSVDGEDVAIVNIDNDSGGGGGGGGSGGPEPVPPTNISVSLPVCSPTNTILLQLSGSQISDYIIAENIDFAGALWQSYIPDQGTEALTTQTMTTSFVGTNNDGLHTLYIRFRNGAQQTGTFVFDINIDEATQCDNSEPETEPVLGCESIFMTPLSSADRARYQLGVSPTSGDLVPVDKIFPGDYIRSKNFETVYCIDRDLSRRPFVDETSYFTHARSFENVKWVSDETLREFSIQEPMLPREHVAFVKFQSRDEVYYFHQDPNDPTTGKLRWVQTEELATFIAGENWADYVLDLNPTLTNQFVFEAPYMSEEDILNDGIEFSEARKRELLNERSSSEEDRGITSEFFNRLKEFTRAAIETIQETASTGAATLVIQSLRKLL